MSSIDTSLFCLGGGGGLMTGDTFISFEIHHLLALVDGNGVLVKGGPSDSQQPGICFRFEAVSDNNVSSSNVSDIFFFSFFLGMMVEGTSDRGVLDIVFGRGCSGE
ncbi:unnamed protein product [Owenia fusiformis]|uniref:Uncharacterized protein n=1 Tax=Owenia fusiformis TaxID=6347 RepID=A0A8J1Y7F8_OWEFU|nr:unnamed protein product [Owenia fusiformis]